MQAEHERLGLIENSTVQQSRADNSERIRMRSMLRTEAERDVCDLLWEEGMRLVVAVNRWAGLAD